MNIYKMADAVARREARRRRILENSENRMQKVLLQTKYANDKENLESKIEENQLYKEGIQHKTDFFTHDVDYPDKNRQDYNKLETVSPLKEKEISSPEAEDSVRQRTKNTVKIEKNEPVIQQEETELKYEKRDRKMHMSPSRQFELMRITGSLVLSILTRLMLQTGYGLLYFQSIILPFFCFEALLFLYRKHNLKVVTIQQSGSMMTGVLMLCGIKPDLIKLYREIMGYVSAVTEDLFFFLFCFFIGQFVIT